MNIGDKVRFLNDIGGGTVVGFQGKDVVLVQDEDGFEMPTLVKECVVVGGDEYSPSPASASTRQVKKTNETAVPVHPIEEEDEPVVTFKPRPLERRGGDVVNICMAFAPSEPKDFQGTAFEAYVVNDSNYTLRYALFSHEGTSCTLLYEGEAMANTKIFLGEIPRGDLPTWERITFQGLLFKPNKLFQPQSPLNVGLRIDLTKFYKLHAFTSSPFFTENALITDVVREGKPVRNVFVEAAEMETILVDRKRKEDRPHIQSARVSSKADPSEPLVIDLHAHELLETTAGMNPRDILEYQIKVFTDTMDAHKGHKGRKIVFIHGKGEGVLRAALVEQLKRRYKQCRWQDASFREYGFGATMVTI